MELLGIPEERRLFALDHNFPEPVLLGHEDVSVYLDKIAEKHATTAQTLFEQNKLSKAEFAAGRAARGNR